MDVFQKLATFGLALLLGAQIEAATNTNSLTASRVEMVFEQAANVRRLSSEQAGLHHPVLLRGVITYTDGTYNTFVQDESAGIYIFINNPGQAKEARTDIHAGQQVEIRGFTWPGDFAPCVAGGDGGAVAISILGEGSLPVPQPMPPEAPKQVALDGQWVEVSGVVRRVTRRDTRAQITLQIAGKTLPLLLPGYGAGKPLPLALLGARVQARGVVGFIANKERQMTGIRLYVPNLAQVEVEKPPEDIFLKPIREVASLLQFHPTADDDLVRLAGVVTLALPGQGFYLRDRTGSLWVQSQQETKLNSGDVVDVVGFPASLPVKPGLADAVFRLTGKQESPAPVRLTNSLQLEDKLKDELVSLDAVVVESQGGKTGTRLVLQSAERLIQCRLVGGHSQELLPERGSVVRVNGVYVAGGLEVLGADTQLPTLLLNTPDELELLSAPPWLTPARLRLTLGIFTLVSSLSVVVIALMRHQIRRQTKAISQHIEQAAVQTERTRIARDWHDTLGQQLVGLGLQLDTARLLAERQPENAVPALNVAVAMLRHSHEEARHSIWHLHASELEQVGLADVLRRLAQESTPAEGKPNVILEIRGQILKLPLAVESHLLRIVQEAVSNALRHAHAAHITMSLEYAPDRVRLRVGDDGCGIPEAACASQGIGLLSMRQRAIKAGGLFLFNSKPGGGTEVIVEIPRAEFPNPPN